MTDKILTSIKDIVESGESLDRQSTFDALWALTGELMQRVQERFELNLDPSCEDLMPYQGNDGANGYLATYAGPKVDWLVHSWTGNPKASFTNMHLTIGLGPHIDAPHFGFALGTLPDFFVYMDYLPRRDMWANPEYGDQYYGKANEAYLDMQADKNFRPFISRDFYTRAAQSPASLCFGAEVNDENFAVIRERAHAHLDTWFDLVDAATEVPVEERSALAERDLSVRRSITVRDPANVVVERLFGEELGARLVTQLWGGDRKLPRPC
ncbi:MAG: hypothetical protein ACSHXK_04665 [Oceanococcus sp.]